MNSDPGPSEMQRRCSRITRSFSKRLFGLADRSPPEDPRPVVLFEPSEGIRPRLVGVDVKTIRPPRRRSRCSHFTVKRRKRRSLSAGCTNFVSDTNAGPGVNDSDPSEFATSFETPVDRVSVDHDGDNETCGTEGAFTLNQMAHRGKRAYSELECEEPIVSSKRRLIVCQRSGQDDLDAEEQRNEIDKGTPALTETLSVTIKQEPSSPILSPPSFALPLTPSDTDPCSSPKDDPLSPSQRTSSIKKLLNSDSVGIPVTESNSSQPTRFVTTSSSHPLTPPSESASFYESVTPSILNLKSDLDHQQPEQIFKQESIGSSFGENHQSRGRYFSSPLRISNHRTENKTENLPANWLDVSKVLIRPELIVRAIRSDGVAKNNQSTKILFNSLYRQFGKYRNEIVVVDGRNCIKILTNDQDSRSKVKSELEEIFASIDKLDVKMFVGIPDLRRPLIQFEFNRRINHFWTNDIKRENQWPHNSSILFKNSSYMKNGQYLVSIEVDSTIRDLIEQNDGTISVDNQRVNIVDGLGLAFCYNCLAYNRCSIMTCNNRNRCLYCANYHDNECWYKNQPSQWFCYRCRVRGHSIISKDCPTLLIKLRPRLAKVDHRYKYVFLQEYDLQKVNPKNALARLF